MGKISRGGGDYTCKRGSTQNSGREQLYADAMKGESGGRTEEQECQTILRTQEVWGAQGESLSQSCRLKESAPTPARFSHWLGKLGLNHKSSGGAAGPSAGVVSQVRPLGQETRVTCVHRCQAIHSVLSLCHRCLSECLSCFAKFLSSPRPCTL